AIHPDDRKGVTRAWIDALEKKSQFFVTGRVWHKNSESYRHFESRGVAIKDSDGNIREWIGTITDIHDKLLVEKEKQLAQEQMEYTYLHDSLTDLPNRILFNQRLLEEINKCDEKKTLLSVMIIDLDRFKMINESLGHAVGDRLLQEVGLRLASCLDETDVLARLGGDEFGILLTDIEREEEVASVCQRILDSLKHPFSVDKNELYMTPSVGITVFPFDGDDSSTLLKNADSALYRAKEQGRNNFQFYNPSMNATSFQQLTLESALRRALKNNEFLVYYQPQIDPITGHIVELEALLRWMHPDLGLTFPDEFIKSAETTGLIESIGEWVLRTALKDVSEWHAMGFDDLDIAVNLSARQFKQRHLVRAIRKVINEIKFDASHLELELTESVLVDNSTTVFNTLNELKKDGIRFAIDDFNTGYSSLNYIKRFPIDILKIDKSFVRGLPGKEKDAAIANSIINLAHSLNMKVVAEGVERVEQLNFLRDRGCDKVQGYFISPPVSSQAITELLRKNK
ncbi:MAG TPA: EAL domain-containing protein, partial [Verrucomicrobiae bacterium]|nr:EAL domain-containing protein [Verrucomicrobiae bacterium]